MAVTTALTPTSQPAGRLPAKLHTVSLFLKTPTAQLALTYLLLILVMSVCFSIVLYNTSSHELGRQVPPNALFRTSDGGVGSGQSPEISQFFMQRIAEARQALLTKLVILNGLVLLVGTLLSYKLARRNLEPIEQAMEAQSQFVSDASHELRTPLTAIQTSNEVALRKPGLKLAEARRLIEHNTEDVKRLQALSDGLLNLARQNKPSVLLTPVDLQDVVGDAMNQVVGQATVKQITVNDAAANHSVLADRTGLERVLVILLDNAIKYSHPKGTVQLTTREKGKFVYLDVRDGGIGIRASDLPHVFRRFYRADNARTSDGHSRSGYGLGLAIAEQIMRRQQGDISVVSTVGQGSTFSLRLARS